MNNLRRDPQPSPLSWTRPAPTILDLAGNRLLAKLPKDSTAELLQCCHVVHLKPAAILHRANEPISSVLFPISGVISLSMPIDGKTIEIALIGNEGVWGLPVYLGADQDPMAAVALTELRALRLESAIFRGMSRRHLEFASILAQYTRSFMVILARAAACNSLHSVEQRCARWLLSASDHLHTADLVLTHAALSKLLAVRRASVSEVAKRLQDQRLILYRQGRITILDRAGLKQLACPCYELIAQEFDCRLLPAQPPRITPPALQRPVL